MGRRGGIGTLPGVNGLLLGREGTVLTHWAQGLWSLGAGLSDAVSGYSCCFVLIFAMKKRL